MAHLHLAADIHGAALEGENGELGPRGELVPCNKNDVVDNLMHVMLFSLHLLRVYDKLRAKYLCVPSLELHCDLVCLAAVYLHPELFLRLQLEHLLHGPHLSCLAASELYLCMNLDWIGTLVFVPTR